jgi:hypothetical protein
LKEEIGQEGNRGLQEETEMKKLVVCLSAVALLTTPAMAELADNAIYLDQSHWTATPIDGGRPYTQAGVYCYDNMWTAIGGPAPRTAYLSSLIGGYVPAGISVLDDFILSGSSQTFTVMHYIYWASLPSSMTQIVGFFSDTLGSSGWQGATFAMFSVTGLPGGGGWIITLQLPTVVAPHHHIWGGMIALAPVDHPLGGPPGIGGHTPKAWYAGGQITSWEGNLMWAIGVPEPTTVGLLALGGLLALRRRR